MYHKWVGKCDACNSWNTIEEEIIKKSSKLKTNTSLEIVSLDDNVENIERIDTKITELNRVLGGGLVEGSAVLIGGNPGIGKSTLLLQLANNLESSGKEVLYASGEESVTQVALRAKRLGVDAKNIKFTSVTNVEELVSVINKNTNIKVLIVDSIQTIFSEAISSPPGTVSQVKFCANELITSAKKKGCILILVGHVTKDGNIAGPKMLEHMVDTVAYFENYSHHDYRMVRTFKNRFGAVNEIGLFEMQSSGLREVQNPSEFFLDYHHEPSSGNSIVVSMEGTRPILAEVQALVSPSFLATPRRAVVGWDVNRLSVMIAIINSKLKLNLLNKEVYLNVVGGLKISEPAADLAVVAALLSAELNCIIPNDTVFFGEVGLSGEIRPVPYQDARISEIKKLGFKRVVMAKTDKRKQKTIAPANNDDTIDVVRICHIRELLNLIKK